MLGALLLNIPQFSQHGTPTPALVRSSTSWNPRWSEMYGPDARKARKDKKLVKEAVEALRSAEYVPAPIQEAKEIVHARSLVSELENYQPDTDDVIIYILESYFVFLAWRRRDDEAIATALLIMD